jgi:predicted RNA-binding Zn-ribbon protein involved in translation (DUF1610 family)
MIVFGRKCKARLVPDGRFEKRRCPECGKTAVFREALIKSTYHVFWALELFDSESTKYCCDKCSSTMDLEDTLDPELTEKERVQLEAIAAKEAKLDAKRRELDDKKAREREAAKAKSVEDELAQMKKKLGLE